jgi:hypothetical protein
MERQQHHQHSPLPVVPGQGAACCNCQWSGTLPAGPGPAATHGLQGRAIVPSHPLAPSGPFLSLSLSLSLQHTLTEALRLFPPFLLYQCQQMHRQQLAAAAAVAAGGTARLARLERRRVAASTEAAEDFPDFVDADFVDYAAFITALLRGCGRGKAGSSELGTCGCESQAACE